MLRLLERGRMRANGIVVFGGERRVLTGAREPAFVFWIDLDEREGSFCVGGHRNSAFNNVNMPALSPIPSDRATIAMTESSGARLAERIV